MSVFWLIRLTCRYTYTHLYYTTYQSQVVSHGTNLKICHRDPHQKTWFFLQQKLEPNMEKKNAPNIAQGFSLVPSSPKNALHIYIYHNSWRLPFAWGLWSWCLDGSLSCTSGCECEGCESWQPACSSKALLETQGILPTKNYGVVFVGPIQPESNPPNRVWILCVGYPPSFWMSMSWPNGFGPNELLDQTSKRRQLCTDADS